MDDRLSQLLLIPIYPDFLTPNQNNSYNNPNEYNTKKTNSVNDCNPDGLNISVCGG